MKKALLLASLAAVAMPVFAETEGVTYDAKGGYTFENVWMNCAAKGEWNSLVDAKIPTLDYMATAIALNGKIYVADSKSTGLNPDGTTGLLNQGQLHVFDYATGAYEKNIALTVDGKPLEELLCANTVDVDDFGHLVVCGYQQNTWNATDNKAIPLKLYIVDPETGACTYVPGIQLGEEEGYTTGRIDYIDLAGDITREQAHCVVMAVPSAPADQKYVYGWECEQGGTEWTGHLAGGDYSALNIEESYPVIEGPWGGCAWITILPDDEISASLYYIDTFTTCPALYDLEGNMVSSFQEITEEDKDNPVLVPKTMPVGAFEFSLGDDTFMMYPYEEYEPVPCANRARIARYGDIPGDMSKLENMYDFPQIGMGTLKGNGRRTHVLQSRIVTDENGKQAAEILSFKTGNGLALYRLAQEGFNAGVNDMIVEDNSNAPVEYFNLQGIRVANPENGIFIRRQGSEVSKVAL